MRAMAVLWLGAAVRAGAMQPEPQTRVVPAPDPDVVAAATAAAEAGGTGPWKATMVAERSLPTHTVYRPRDLSSWGGKRRLPVVVWGNGACVNYGNRFRYLLTEIASHGYLAVAIGPIGPAYLEGSANQDPPGTVLTGPPAPPPRVQATRSEQLIDAMDWAFAQSKDRKSPYFGKLDTGHIAVMGQSCGGLQAIVASADPRTSTTVILNSGVLPAGREPLIGAEATKEGLRKFHAPVAYITGDSSDQAYLNANDDFSRIDQVPVFRGWEKGMGHTATYRTPNGGAFAGVAVAWLEWQLKGDVAAGAWFSGKGCGLCTDPNWVVSKKNLP